MVTIIAIDASCAALTHDLFTCAVRCKIQDSSLLQTATLQPYLRPLDRRHDVTLRTASLEFCLARLLENPRIVLTYECTAAWCSETTLVE